MFILPGIAGLFLFLYVRPQEFIEALAPVPLLPAILTLALAGWVLDLRLRYTRLEVAPHVVWVLGFTLWSALTLAVRAPEVLGNRVIELVLPPIVFLVVAQGVQTFRGLQALAAMLLAIGLVLSAVGIDQGLAPRTCHRVRYEAGTELFVDDGRPCATREQCTRTFDDEPGTHFACEHAGPAGTSSVGGRVRYRGILQDPNELALAVATALPFAFAFFSRRPGGARGALLVVSLVMVGVCVVFTKSRGGQLVFLSALAVYFVRRFGVKGLALGILCAGPILWLGGRGGEEASASALERTGAWYQGIELIKLFPAIGTGRGLFTEHYYLTAHNSYVLTAAELGLPGYFLWSVIFYLSLKIPVQVLGRVNEPVARAWALALLASLAGMAMGIFFLSFAYHPVLWCFIGLSAALAAAVRGHDPTFRVRFGVADVALVVAGDMVILVLVYIYTRLNGG